jgi:ABC-type transport system substrate-binding protein
MILNLHCRSVEITIRRTVLISRGMRMRILIIAIGSLALGACGQQSSPSAPTTATSSSVSASPSAVDVAAPGSPNHFDPPPIQGFESSKWHDLNYKNPKYVFGRALVGKDPTGENLKRVAESQGILYLGKDLVAFPDGTVFDCVFDFEGPKARWLFQISH